jgi:ferritin-like protein
MNEQAKIPPGQEENIKAAVELSNQINPLLFKQKPEVIGSVLATMTATWLAGHRGKKGMELFADKDKDGEQYRSLMMAHFIKTVMQMLPEIMQEADEIRMNLERRG